MPLTTWLIFAVAYFGAMNHHNKEVWRANERGELPEGDRPPPDLYVVWPFIQYGLLIWLAVLSWQQALAVFAGLFLVSVIANTILFLIGGLFQIPFNLIVNLATGGKYKSK